MPEYHNSASQKDLGKKRFAFSTMNKKSVESILDFINNQQTLYLHVVPIPHRLPRKIT